MQCDEWASVWARYRNPAQVKPVTRDDVHFLREARDYGPFPNKQFIETVQRKSARPDVSTHHPAPPALPCRARQFHNLLEQIANETRRSVRPAFLSGEWSCS